MTNKMPQAEEPAEIFSTGPLHATINPISGRSGGPHSFSPAAAAKEPAEIFSTGPLHLLATAAASLSHMKMPLLQPQPPSAALP